MSSILGRLYDENNSYLGTRIVDRDQVGRSVDLYRDIERTPMMRPPAPVRIAPPEPMWMPPAYDIGLPNRGPTH